MKTFFLLFSLAFATVFLLNLGLPSVATTTGKKGAIRPHLAQNQNHKGPEKLICL